MPKKINPENLIGTELDKVEDKVREFQRYMKDNNISGVASTGGEFTLSEENQEQLHKEITMQIKMMDAVLNWLPLLKKFRETTQAKEEVRGGIEVGEHFKNS